MSSVASVATVEPTWWAMSISSYSVAVAALLYSCTSLLSWKQQPFVISQWWRLVCQFVSIVILWVLCSLPCNYAPNFHLVQKMCQQSRNNICIQRIVIVRWNHEQRHVRDHQWFRVETSLHVWAECSYSFRCTNILVWSEQQN